VRCVGGGPRVDERQGEQHQTDQRDPDGESFVERQSSRVALDAEERQYGDTGGTDGLNEAERREPEGGYIDEPARGLGAEADQPAAVSEQEPERAERSPRVERR